MKRSDTFCSAPWFGLRINYAGRYQPCCVIQEEFSEFIGEKNYNIQQHSIDDWMTSEYVQYLRKELTQGKKIKECSQCWQKEESNLQSERQICNNSATNNTGHNIDNTWINSFLKNTNNYKDYVLVNADVKVSNVCNFSCAMCNPYDSSKIYDKWKKDTTSDFVQEKIKANPTYFLDIEKLFQSKTKYKLLSDILEHPIVYLKLLGGEPLLDKELLNVLQNLDTNKKSKMSITIITNGSQDLVDATHSLRGFKSVNFIVSLEGVNKMQEYVRQGSDWSFIEQNIIKARRQGIEIGIHHTLQAMSILHLSDLLVWAHKNKLPVDVALLIKPDYLSLSVLPDYLKEHALEKLFATEQQNMALESQIQSITKLIRSMESNRNLFQKFLDYVVWYEQKSLQKLQDLCPEFYKTIS
jgi:molybdenum cofactor biosynthesis enzyme MoaA